MKGAIATLTLVVVLGVSLLSVCSMLVKAESKTINVPDDYPTIQAAINAANENDTVFVKRGTYDEQTLTLNKTIGLIGENADATNLILHPPSKPLFGSGFMVYDNPLRISANQVVLSGFTIAADGGTISAEGTSIQISGNHLKIPVSVKGNTTQISGNKGDQSSITVTGSNNSISQNVLNESSIICEGSFNRLLDNRITRKQLSEDTGIVLSGVSNLIFNNTVTNDSITLKGDSNFNIIGKNNCSSLLISRSYNNTVFGNHVAGILGFVGSNNIFYRNDLMGILLGNQYMDTPDNTFCENSFDFTGGREILVYTGVISSLTFDNGTVGNYWSDYLDQYPYSKSSDSGIGNTPYIVYLTQPNSISPFTYSLGDKYNYELTITDRYPLMSPPNISDVQIQMPAWANTTSLPVIPMPTQEPEPFPIVPIAAGVTVVAVVIVAAGVLLYNRRRSKEAQQTRGKQAQPSSWHF